MRSLFNSFERLTLQTNCTSQENCATPANSTLKAKSTTMRHLSIFPLAILALLGCSSNQPQKYNNQNNELRKIQIDAMKKASTSASDYSVCASLSAVAMKARPDLRLMEKVEVIESSCRDRLDAYRGHMGTYFYAIYFDTSGAREEKAALVLKEQTRSMIIRTLTE